MTTTLAAHKYGAKRTEYNGESYPSKLEADYARHLDMLQVGGVVKWWERGKPLALIPREGRYAPVTYTPDFWVWEHTGEQYWVETKGVETPVFRLKMRLFRHVFPDARLKIVYKDGERWLP